MSRRPPGPDREQVFRSLYESVYPDLLRFVQRRCDPVHVDDVVADACLVVWRRLDELPASHDSARAWIFGIARNVLLSRHRGERRRRALAVRLADPTASMSSAGSGVDPAADEVVSRVDLGRAWSCLSDDHQEALALAVFEGLNAPEGAAVLGISPVAFRLRLSRARHALRRQIAAGSTFHGQPVRIQGRTTTS